MGLFNKEKKNSIIYAYTQDEKISLEQFIKDNYGDYDLVLHEKISTGINLDIAIVPPTEKNDYYKLITMGMGAYPMHVPSELKPYNLERSELVLFLPKDWKIDSSDEVDYWPIRYLKILARLPINNKTWLGFGHTISSNNKNTTYADNTKFCSMMLLTALNNNGNKLNFNLKNRGKINFYQLYPIYEEELKYKLENGSESFLNLISNKDLSPVLNIKRKNYGIEKPKEVKQIKKAVPKKTTTKKAASVSKEAPKKESVKKRVSTKTTKKSNLKTKATKAAVKKVATKKVKKAVKNTVKNKTKKK